MLLILTGRSCSGKTMIETELIKNHGYKKVMQYTTHPVLYKDMTDSYDIMSEKEFKRHMDNNEFAEVDYRDGYLYGTLKKDLMADEKLVITLPPKRAILVQNSIRYPEACICHIQTDLKTAALRMIKRENSLTAQKMAEIMVQFTADDAIFSDIHADLEVTNVNGCVISTVAKTLAGMHEDIMQQNLQ